MEYTYECKDCENVFTLNNVKMKFYKDPQDCPECGGDKTGKRIVDGCPMMRMGGEGSDRQIASMQASFRQRYVKKELDDVKHKHGENTINDALRGGELQRRTSGKDS